VSVSIQIPQTSRSVKADPYIEEKSRSFLLISEGSKENESSPSYLISDVKNQAKTELTKIVDSNSTFKSCDSGTKGNETEESSTRSLLLQDTSNRIKDSFSKIRGFSAGFSTSYYFYYYLL
jgi:hypothetical protein